MDTAQEVFGPKSAGLFGMLYDMQRCTDSKVQLANEKIDQWNDKCSHCQDDFDGRYIKKFEVGKWSLPFSKFGFLLIFAAVFIMLGLGILELKDILNFKWLLRI